MKLLEDSCGRLMEANCKVKPEFKGYEIGADIWGRYGWGRKESSKMQKWSAVVNLSIWYINNCTQKEETLEFLMVVKD